MNNNLNLANCPSCGGNIEQKGTTFTVDLDFGVLIIRYVPTHLCSICGEKWYSDDVSEKLETIIDKAEKIHTEIHLHDEIIVSRFDEVA